MKTKLLVFNLLCIPIVCTTIAFNGSNIAHINASINDLAATNIDSIFPAAMRNFGAYNINNEPNTQDIIKKLYNYVKDNNPTNVHVINDLTIGARTGTGPYARQIGVKSGCTEYTGSCNITYSISTKTDLSTLGAPLSIAFASSQPTNKEVLQAFVSTNALSISINQLDIDVDATKTIVDGKAFSYQIIPSSFSSTVSGSVKVVVHKTGQDIALSALIPNTYISIFNTATTDTSDIKSKVKYWNDYYINDEIASALSLSNIGYDRIYEGRATASLSDVYSFITVSIGLTWMYVPDNSYISRGPNATATTAWTLTSNFVGTSLDCSNVTTPGFDCFVNNNSLNGFKAVGVKPIIRVCDLTHTSVKLR